MSGLGPLLLSLALLQLPAGFDRKHWLEEEVPYIISSREKEEFKRIQSEEELSRFLERFWKRRDPDTATERNEFREEHYRRLAYVREHFSVGKAGWRTDRGRIYILYGEPQERLQFPSISLPRRPGAAQGPGLAEVVDLPASEIWYYPYLPSTGEAGSFLFMKVSVADLGQFWRQASAKRPPVAPTPAGPAPAVTQLDGGQGLYGGSGSAGRDFHLVYVSNRQRFADMRQFYYELENNPLELDIQEMFDLLQKVYRNPGDLLELRENLRGEVKQEVSSNVFFGRLPLEVKAWFLQSGNTQVYIPVALHVPGAALEQTRQLLVLAEITRGQEEVAYFVDQISIPQTESPRLRFEGLTYQGRMAVEPGPQTLTVYVLDRQGGRYARVEKALRVPARHPGAFSLSDIILCDRVASLKKAHQERAFRSQREWITYSQRNPLQVDDLLLRPRAGSRFRRKDRVTAFLEIYNPRLKKGLPQVDLKLRVLREGREVASLAPRTLSHTTSGDLPKITYALTFPLGSFEPGEYTLEIQAADRLAARQVSARTVLTVH